MYSNMGRTRFQFLLDKCDTYKKESLQGEEFIFNSMTNNSAFFSVNLILTWPRAGQIDIVLLSAQ